jgi:hypothetical protein
MNRSTSSRSKALPVAALALATVAALAVVANGAFGRAPTPGSPVGSDRPSPAPTTQPSDRPSPAPTAQPSSPPVDGSTKVDLENLTGNAVSVVIADETGTVVDASSGKPGDGMSVRWFDVKVENVDATTLSLTWVGLPVDDEVALSISKNDGQYRFRMVQAAPPAQSDAVGFDRVLIVEFDAPVSADDVEATIQESLDTTD